MFAWSGLVGSSKGPSTTRRGGVIRSRTASRRSCEVSWPGGEGVVGVFGWGPVGLTFGGVGCERSTALSDSMAFVGVVPGGLDSVPWGAVVPFGWCVCH